jgi:hypothetical protein
MRRVLRMTTAPIFSSFNRMVFGLAVARGSFSKQVQLLVLDAIFHVAPGAVNLVIQEAVRLWQVGHHKTGIGAVRTVLGFNDDSARPVPAAGTVENCCKYTLFFASEGMLQLCQI